MKDGRVSAVIVGADRVAANGTPCNSSAFVSKFWEGVSLMCSVKLQEILQTRLERTALPCVQCITTFHSMLLHH